MIGGHDIPHSRAAPLWAGRTLALIGIVLVALNLRTAVAAISPIAGDIAVDIPLNNVALGVLGTIPPIAFGLSAIISPTVARKLGLELFLVVAIGLMIAGHLTRTTAASYVPLLLGSVLTLLGMGVANALLPPLVKRYFPDRIGVMTALYVMLASVSAALPALIAVPVAQTTGWRTSLAIWLALSAVSLIPWLAILRRTAGVGRSHSAADSDPAHESLVGLGRPIWQSTVAWTLAAVFGMACFNVYAMFAWLPDILAQTVASSGAESGAMLAVYAAMGLPTALLVPLLAVRMKNVGLLVQVGVLFLIVGYLGMVLAPSSATWLWVVLIGLGPMPVAICLTLINLRSRTMAGAVALSGFVQGVGYTIAALGPLLIGVLHEATGGWTVVFCALIISASVVSAGGFSLRKPTFVEDQLRHHPKRPAGN